MDQFDPVLAGVLAAIAVCLGFFLEHQKHQIRRLDRRIAEREAAAERTDETPSAAR